MQTNDFCLNFDAKPRCTKLYYRDLNQAALAGRRHGFADRFGAALSSVRFATVHVDPPTDARHSTNDASAIAYGRHCAAKQKNRSPTAIRLHGPLLGGGCRPRSRGCEWNPPI